MTVASQEKLSGRRVERRQADKLDAIAPRGSGELRSNLLGVINGVRTRDIQDHNLALYQLSYDHRDERVFYPNRRGTATV